MRTTLTIDDDLLFAVKERAKAQGRTASEVISDLVRTALTSASDADETAEDEFFGFRPLPPRGTIVTNEIIDRIRSEEGV